MNMYPDSQLVTLSIQLDKEFYNIGEPVWLKISLRNNGNKATKIPRIFAFPSDDPAKNNVKIQLCDSSGQSISRISHTMTGRALYYPQLEVLHPGESYQDSILIADTFKKMVKRRKRMVALWSFGENPEILTANEYPLMAQGIFEVQMIYWVGEEHLAKLEEQERKSIWQGELVSNTIKFSIK